MTYLITFFTNFVFSCLFEGYVFVHFMDNIVLHVTQRRRLVDELVEGLLFEVKN